MWSSANFIRNLNWDIVVVVSSCPTTVRTKGKSEVGRGWKQRREGFSSRNASHFHQQRKAGRVRLHCTGWKKTWGSWSLVCEGGHRGPCTQQLQCRKFFLTAVETENLRSGWHRDRFLVKLFFLTCRCLFDFPCGLSSENGRGRRTEGRERERFGISPSKDTNLTWSVKPRFYLTSITSLETPSANVGVQHINLGEGYKYAAPNRWYKESLSKKAVRTQRVVICFSCYLYAAELEGSTGFKRYRWWMTLAQSGRLE